MLGKLMKHEWLSTWKVPTALCIYLGILTILGCTSFVSPLWQSDNMVVQVIAGFSIFIYILSLIGICIAIFAYFVVRFYRNMYTDEGYLMHTLPVKSWEHILTKGLTFFIWSLISVLAVFFSIFSIIFSAALSVSGINWGDFFSQLQEFWPEIMREFRAFWGTSLATTIILCIVAAICQLIFSILMIYGSISIGQTFNRHKVMASFIAYVCLNMVLSLVRSLLQIPLLLIRTEQLDRFTSVSSILGPSFCRFCGCFRAVLFYYDQIRRKHFSFFKR